VPRPRTAAGHSGSTIDGGMTPESGPAIELPAEISSTALSAGLCSSRPLAPADGPLVDQRSSVSGCFALFMLRAAGRPDASPARAADGALAVAHFTKPGGGGKRIHETERRENLSEPRATNVHCLITDGASPDRNPLLRPAGDLPASVEKIEAVGIRRRRRDAFGNQFI
jgi:hypothetical protein